MFKSVKKSWFAVSLIMIALSLSAVSMYAGCGCGKKKQNKPNQIVLDKIVNELVCQSPDIGFRGNSAPKFGMQSSKFIQKLGDKYYC